MSVSSLFSLFNGSGTSNAGNVPNTAKSEDSAGSSEKGMFMGMMKSIIQKAATKTNSKPQQLSDVTEKNRQAFGQDKKSMDPAKKEAIERIAVLTANGSLDRRQLENMSDDEIEDLEQWVLQGAGGMFAPYPQQDIDATEIISEIMLENLAGKTMQDVSDLAGRMGLDNLDSETMEKLGEELKNLLAENTEAAADATLSEMLEQVSGEELKGMLKEAMSNIGMSPDKLVPGTDSASQMLDDMPDVVLKSLAVEVLEVSGADQEKNAGKDELLKGLETDAMLMEKLLSQRTGGTANKDTFFQERDENTEEQLKIDDLVDIKKGDIDTEVEFELPEGELTELDVTAEDMSTDDSSLLIDTLPTDTADEMQATSATEVRPINAAQNIVRNVEVTQSQAAANVERIEQMIQLSTKRNINHVSLQLSPPELGKVTMRIQMKAGNVQVVLQTENAEARNHLAVGHEQLKENLLVKGINLDSFDVSVDSGDVSEGDQGSWSSGQGRSNRGNSGGESELESQVGEEGTDYSISGDGDLNLVV